MSEHTPENLQSNDNSSAEIDATTNKCPGCGSALTYAPGSESLKCSHCGTVVEIKQSETKSEIIEHDFHAALAAAEMKANSTDRVALETVSCQGCGASVTIDSHALSDFCSFCGSSLKNANAVQTSMIPPQYVLPFKIANDTAWSHFKTWLNKLWFAPSAVKKFSNAARLSGVYLPYCTFDTSVDAQYTGERGDAYYVQVPYTVTVNGKQERRMRNERRIRWHRVSGRIHCTFDDILVSSTKSLPSPMLDKLEPWDLESLVPFDHSYMQGYKSEVGNLSIQTCFSAAVDKMEPQIRECIKRDIGGDEQRISSISPSYKNITYKSVMLPLWISSYMFNEKVYRFIINARTGEVHGERPWSAIKIVLAVAGGAAAIGLLIKLFMTFSS